MFKINYILKKPEKIVPWGDEAKSLHWFGLTDGLLWIDAGDSVIYEYARPHPDEFEEQVKYDDYQLSRFIEDILELTPVISESVPEYLFDVIDHLADDFQEWKSMYFDRNDEEFERFYDEFYAPLSDWFYDRVLSSGHLVCGPSIGFFRCGDKLKIVWDSDTLEDGSEMWKFPRGIYETDYQSFVSEVSGFISSFTADMDKQVADVVSKGIPGVYVDTDALVRENEQRKKTFEQQLSCLNSNGDRGTDWDKIRELYVMMCSETGNSDRYNVE